MIPVQMSSGNLLADRRAHYGESCLPGDPAAACDLYQQALALCPRWTAGWVRLGEIRAAARLPDAEQAFTRALALDPEDRLGVALKLDLLRPRSLGDRMPAAFVELLFDSYAAGFDRALLDGLAYRGPGLLRAGLGAGYGRALDLGCGTGLMGAELRGICDWLEGWDISGEMLRAARAKGLYDHLDKRDLGRLAPQHGLWQLITASDVFNYLGALERIIAWCAAALQPGGMLAFTVEAHDGAEAWILRDSCRYAHAAPHLQALLGQAGFKARLTPGTLRQDRGAPVPCHVVHAIRLSDPAPRSGGLAPREPAHIA